MPWQIFAQISNKILCNFIKISAGFSLFSHFYVLSAVTVQKCNHSPHSPQSLDNKPQKIPSGDSKPEMDLPFIVHHHFPALNLKMFLIFHHLVGWHFFFSRVTKIRSCLEFSAHFFFVRKCMLRCTWAVRFENLFFSFSYSLWFFSHLLCLNFILRFVWFPGC
jgi:hypothetical protein